MVVPADMMVPACSYKNGAAQASAHTLVVVTMMLTTALSNDQRSGPSGLYRELPRAEAHEEVLLNAGVAAPG